MDLRNWKVTYKGIFLAAWFVVLISRILILTENYTWPIDPVLLEILYLLLTVCLVLMSKKGVLVFQRGTHWFVLIVFLLHTLLWGVVFVDSRFAALIHSHFESQIMFAVILCVNVWAVQSFDAADAFLKSCCAALSCTLMFQLITNISDVDLSNLVNIMSVSERTRVNFGFGHYNTLGAACVCNILLLDWIGKSSKSQRSGGFALIVGSASVIMLLCSASRSALTSLLLYFVVCMVLSINEWHISKRFILAIQLVISLAAAIVIVYVLFAVDVNELLIAAQRSHLFTHTLPMFFETGKIWLGLGFASNVAYANLQTPYVTYWLDNGYIYLLVTTGWLGVGLIISALLCIGKGLIRRCGTPQGKRMLALFAVYLYIALFEAFLFNSGVIGNYIYLPWFLLNVSQKENDA